MQGKQAVCKKVFAVDIGGTAAKFAFVSKDGVITARGRFGTAGMTTFPEFFEQLCDAVAHARAHGVLHVGISSPGVYNAEGYCVGNVENLPFLSGKNMPALLKVRFPDMSFVVGNDGMAAAMGEYCFGVAKNCPSFICITLGTGIGGAYVLDGKPHLGHHFQSCEVGYTNFKSIDDYYEKKYSTKGILRYLAAKMKRNTIVSGRVFTKKVEEGDPLCSEVFAEWTDGIGQLLANMVLVIDPALIVIGGGISCEGELLRPAIKAAMEAHLPPAFQGKFDLEMASCSNDAGLLGASTHYFLPQN